MTRLRSATRAAIVLLLAVITVVAMGCAPPAVVAVDPVSAPLLADHGVRAVGATTIAPTTVGDVAEQPWSLYLEVSKASGLDFTDEVGVTAELRRTPIDGDEADAAAFILVRDGRAIGAWLSPGGTTSGVLPLGHASGQE
jgi:hypothetical protein